MDYRSLIRAALIAGVLAGLAAGLFGLAVTEHLVDRAIALEEARAAVEPGGVEGHDELFSRRTQKAGLIVGDALYGVAIACLFAGVYGFVVGTRAARQRQRLVLGLVAGAVAATVLVPFLIYPPYPPGVGDPDTLARRQGLFIACVLFAIAAVWVAVRVHERMRARGRAVSVGSGVAVAVVTLGALVLLMPGRSDEILVPARLLLEFRLASLAGQLVFWSVFAALFVRLIGPRSALPLAGLHEPA